MTAIGKRRRAAFVLLLLTIGTAVHALGIQGTSAGPAGFRESQTALLIREFMVGGFDFRSPLPVLGPPYFVPMEFPIYQYLAALLGDFIQVTPLMAGAILALGLYQLSAFLLYLILRNWFDEKTGLIALLLLQLVPFGFQWAASCLIEFLPVCAVLLALYASNRWVNARQNFWVAVSVVSLTIAFLVKPTTAVVLAVLFLVPLNNAFREGVGRLRSSIVLIGPLLVGVASAAAWTRWSDSIKSESQYSEFLTSANLTQWNFGFPSQRFLPGQFLQFGENLAAITGPLLFFLLVVGLAVVLNPRRIEPIALAAAPLIAFLVFTNLFVVHRYYVAAIIAPCVALMAIAIRSLSTLPKTDFSKNAVVLFGVMLLLVAGWSTESGRAAENFYHKFNIRELAQEVQLSTPADAGVIFLGCDWNSEFMYESNRHGLMIRSAADHQVPEEWIPEELSYVVRCYDTQEELKLPSDIKLTQISSNVQRLDRR